MNMRVSHHVIDGFLKKCGGFAFEEGGSVEKRRMDVKVGGRGNENVHTSSIMGKSAGKNSVDSEVKTSKRPKN